MLQNDLNKKRSSRKVLFHLAMLTTIVATAAALTVDEASAAATPSSEEFTQAPKLPYCDEKLERTIGRRLLYITTLDGRMSALDITKSGKLRWSIPTGPGPLISSSIHRLELTNNGQFVRMIPSLSGGIYKFDGESIDPIPITTENLLSSSAKFSDDLVISGGKETRTYGVCARTGQLLYECSMHGCTNNTNDNGADVKAASVAEAVVEVNRKKFVDEDVADEHDDVVSTTASTTYGDDDYMRDEGGYIVPHDPHLDDVIVVRRMTQTVRAVESRTGLERWNFSVGQHEVDLLGASDCHERIYNDLDLAVLDVEIKVVVPEGLICAFSKTEPHLMLWKYKFDHPIVSAWKINAEDTLEGVDLFGSAQWLWEQYDDSANLFDNVPCPAANPSMYLGMYEKQLYIQESITLRKELLHTNNQLYTQMTTGEPNMPKIPWRPIAASSNSLVVFQNGKQIATGTIPPIKENTPNGQELVPYDDDQFALTAQSVLNASEYVNGNGFYLYTDNDWQKSIEDTTCTTGQLPAIEAAPGEVENGESAENSASVAEANTATGNQSGIANHTLTDDLGFSLDDMDAPVKVVILSLWFWWKEIVVIAFTSAVILNMFLGQRQRQHTEIVVIERHVPVATAIEATEASTQALLGPVNGLASGVNKYNRLTQRSVSESTTNSGEHFISRFQSDFDLLQCLGRGGFGVVFEAQNKLDENKYAVKRITLPNKEQSRQRVLREARTLASCEHHNIVRYFHSWVETPPIGWQEEEDRKLLAHEMSTSIQIETPDGSSMPSLAESLARYNDDKLQKYQKDKKHQLLSWVSDATSTACSIDSAPSESYLNGIKEADDEDDDSCIIFRSESQSAALHANDDDDDGDESSTDDGRVISADFNKNAHGINKCLSPDSVAVDIHSNSFDLKNINYTQLSNSFQIEHVRTTDGGEGDYDNNDYGDGRGDMLMPKKSKTKRPQLSLALATKYNNNQNGMPLSSTQQTLQQSPVPTKPSKVYLYIQMQLCRKESLRDWLRENRTEAREQHISHIFHQIVDAVDYVHFKGLIHRDLKPSNIFFSQDGQVKIGDFGLVTDMSDIPNLITNCSDHTGLPSCARHTQQVGTHLYMSPEQLRGQHYDYKVDIYSLGLIFFELHVYFSTEMERIQTLRRLRDGKYPEQFHVEYPSEYELLQQMLATDPMKRPQTKELKQKLNKILRLPEHLEDGRSEAAARAAAARRLSRSRTFSSSE